VNTAASASGPACPPDPGKDHPTRNRSAEAPNTSRLVNMLIAVIGCGMGLFRKMVQPNAVPGESFTRCYGTTEMPVVLRYLLRGLFRADALLQVLHRRAMRGHDMKAWAPRKSGSRKPPGEGEGEGNKRGTNRTPKPPEPEEDVPFADRIPSQKVLRAWARGRSLGKALTEIFRDLAPLREHLDRENPELWRHAELLLNRYGASAAKLFEEVCGRVLPLSAAAARNASRRKRGAPPPKPATPRVLIPIEDLVDTLRRPPWRRTTAFA